MWKTLISPFGYSRPPTNTANGILGRCTITFLPAMTSVVTTTRCGLLRRSAQPSSLLASVSNAFWMSDFSMWNLSGSRRPRQIVAHAQSQRAQLFGGVVHSVVVP
jgi:hypothetical protein